MHRLIFVNRYFFPDHSATSQILSDLAFHLAGTGRRVHVVTSRQHYEDAKAELPREEVVNGVQVHRVASSRFGRRSLVGRSVDYLSFYRSVRRRLLDMARAGANGLLAELQCRAPLVRPQSVGWTFQHRPIRLEFP